MQPRHQVPTSRHLVPIWRRPAAPVIHLPDRELTDEDGEAPTAAKKRTRRGSRGGKNRRKKPAAATATVRGREARGRGTEKTESRPESGDDARGPSENGDWGYTPMSQWGLDDDAA